MGGGKGGGDVETTVRYADYIESKHQDFLNIMVTRRNAAIDQSPYANATVISVDDGFFGVGYTLASFPSLYDMYGKFMAGLDVEALYDQIYGDLMDGSVTNNLVSAEAALLDDDMETTLIPRMETGMRDINATVSSTFIIARAILEQTRLKQVAKFSAELKYQLLPLIEKRWSAHLEWNKNVVATYNEVMKLYYSVKMDVEQHGLDVKAKNVLWPFTVLDYERVAIAAMQGATKSTEGVAGGSKLQRGLSGLLGGASMGAMFGGSAMGGAMGLTNVTGGVTGGLLGLAAAFL
jgi:hypothetical protein